MALDHRCGDASVTPSWGPGLRRSSIAISRVNCGKDAHRPISWLNPNWSQWLDRQRREDARRTDRGG